MQNDLIIIMQMEKYIYLHNWRVNDTKLGVYIYMYINLVILSNNLKNKQNCLI